MNTFLTPSSIAAELRPDLDPEEACEIYTGPAHPPGPVNVRVAVVDNVHTSCCGHLQRSFQHRAPCVQAFRFDVLWPTLTGFPLTSIRLSCLRRYMDKHTFSINPCQRMNIASLQLPLRLLG